MFRKTNAKSTFENFHLQNVFFLNIFTLLMFKIRQQLTKIKSINSPHNELCPPYYRCIPSDTELFSLTVGHNVVKKKHFAG
jgi:hypothetical protein